MFWHFHFYAVLRFNRFPKTLFWAGLVCGLLSQSHGYSATTFNSDFERIILKHRAAGDNHDVHLKHLQRKVLQDPSNGLLLFEYGLALLESASALHWDYLDQALVQFKKAAKFHPDNPFLLMYQGRTLGAKALDMKPSVLTRLRWAREAFKLMDRAIERKPDSPILRMLRADAQLMAHPILRRGGKLKQDAGRIEKWMASAEFQDWPLTLQARFFLFSGCYLAKKEKPKQQVHLNFEKARTLDPNSKTAEEASARIAGTWVELGFEEEKE